MARKPAQTPAQPATTNPRTANRQAVTYEHVVHIAPHQGLVDNLVRTFGLEAVDYDGIRDATSEHLTQAAEAFGAALNDKALAIHLQRIVGSYVASAHGAAQFYGNKVTTARDLTARLQNDGRDDDRDGPLGMESKAERARLFAAEMGVQAFALLAAANGAVEAFSSITGETWKPYEAPLPAAATVSRQSAATEMAAFGG
jgi:hypothetical protein